MPKTSCDQGKYVDRFQELKEASVERTLGHGRGKRDGTRPERLS